VTTDAEACASVVALPVRRPYVAYHIYACARSKARLRARRVKTRVRCAR